jgi:hypothetical protein
MAGLVLISALLAAPGDSGNPVVPAQVRKGTAPAAASDVALERAIRQRFARSKSAAENLQVRVVGGVATIEGQTGVIQRKGAATRMARAAGARQVINKIVISQAARDKASANLAQGRRRVQVKRGEASRGADARR